MFGALLWPIALCPWTVPQAGRWVLLQFVLHILRNVITLYNCIVFTLGTVSFLSVFFFDAVKAQIVDVVKCAAEISSCCFIIWEMFAKLEMHGKNTSFVVDGSSHVAGSIMTP